jgi:ligand-binding sensor domain-containing protein
MIALLAVAHCVIASSPVVATAMAGDARATLTPNSVVLGDHTATPCDSLPAPHPTTIAGWHDQLAVGFRDGGVWTWDGTTFAAIAGLPVTPVRALAAVGDTLWIGTAEGLWSITSSPGDLPAGKPIRFAHRTLGAAPITALTADGAVLRVGADPRGEWKIADGTAELVDKQALIGCFVDGKPRPPGTCVRGAPEVPVHVTALAEYHHHLVIGTFDDGLWEQTATGYRRIPSPRLIDALLVDGDTLYAASATGLYRTAGTTSPAGATQRLTRLELGLPSGHINDLVKSGDTLWLATSRGVAGWDGRSVRMLGTGAARVVYAITVASDGAVWAGTIGGAIRFGADATVRFDRARGTLPGDWVTALIPDEAGGVLAGTYDAGVMRLAADGTSTAVAPLDGPLWINPHGLARLDGTIAAATLGQGLRLSRGTAPKLPDDDVTAVLRIGDTTWVGTRGGLARIPTLRAD